MVVTSGIEISVSDEHPAKQLLLICVPSTVSEVSDLQLLNCSEYEDESCTFAGIVSVSNPQPLKAPEPGKKVLEPKSISFSVEQPSKA